MARSNVYGALTTDVHTSRPTLGGRRNPSEITAWLNSDTGHHTNVSFTASLISSGERKYNGSAIRKTCRTEDCSHKYGDDTTTRQCPECGVIRQGIDTRKVKMNLTLPFVGVGTGDWSAWIEYDHSVAFQDVVHTIEVDITSNPELDVANIASELTDVVPDIHIFGYSLRKLIAKELWMNAYFLKTESRFQVGVIDQPGEVLHPDYDKFDDNEDEYKGAF